MNDLIFNLLFKFKNVLIFRYIDEYYYYAAAICIMSAGGITISIYQTRKVQHKLRALTEIVALRFHINFFHNLVNFLASL